MNRKILIVDDQSEARQLVRMVMEIENCSILESPNGQHGLSMTREHKPDCLIVDVRMPGKIDGLSLCRTIKCDPDLRDIPVIILTAFFSSELQMYGFSVGADACLEKPFEFLRLIQEVDRVTLSV